MPKPSPEFITLRALASEHIDCFNFSLQEIAASRDTNGPNTSTVPVMVDQTTAEEAGNHFRIGITSVASRLALTDTSVIIPLLCGSFELTPSERIINYSEPVMKVKKAALESARILVGEAVRAQIWDYIADIPEECIGQRQLALVPAMLDMAEHEANTSASNISRVG